MQKLPIATAIAMLALPFAVHAETIVTINAIDAKGVGKAVGRIVITEGTGAGVTLTPDLKGLPPGSHGFHVHETGNCGAKMKAGKMEAGEAAGPHYDPAGTHKHAGPKASQGHKGDLPALNVDAAGNATEAVVAPQLNLAELKGRALMIHEGGDNYADQPKPNGGGGTRIACGVVK